MSQQERDNWFWWVLLISLLMAIGSCTHAGKRGYIMGTVTDKRWAPEMKHTTTDYTYDVNGRVVATPTTSGHDEVFVVVFRSFEGDIWEKEGKETYNKFYTGDTVRILYEERLNKRGVVVSLKLLDVMRID